MRRTLIAAAAVTMVITVMGAPAGAGGGGHCDPSVYSRRVTGETAVVSMSQSCFDPTVLYVEEGTEITFVNKDPYMHNLSGPAGSFAANLYKDLRQRDEHAFLLQTEGTYPYMCYLHPGMAGVVVVGDGVSDDVTDVVSSAVDLDDASAHGTDSSAKTGSSTPALAVGLGVTLVLLIAAVAALAVRKPRSATA